MDSINFNTHILGKSGSGKSFFISNQASSLFKEGKKVLFVDYYKVDAFPEGPILLINHLVTFGNDFDNFKYEDLEKMVKDFLQKNSSAKIIISVPEMGEERSARICNFLADIILNNKELFADYFIFIDEVNRFDSKKIEQLLLESKDFPMSLIIAHQYMGQFSEEFGSVLFHACKNIIFNISPFESKNIASTYNVDPALFENLKPYEYKEFEPIS